jgi:curli biogenesis system outer membrane secretion channel CsgG
MIKRQTFALSGLAIFLSGSILSPLLIAPVLADAPGVETLRPKEKRRIAVLDFDFSSLSDTSFLSGVYAGNAASKGVSNLLTNELVKSGQFVVIERSRIDAVLAEQNLGNSGRVEPTTAAQIGRILGVDAVLIGSVTKFSVEGESRDVSVGGFFGIGGSQSKKTATVQIAGRLVSTATAEILAVAEGAGESRKNNGGGSIFGISTSSNSSSDERLLGDAAGQAVTQLATQINSAAPKLSSLRPIAPTVDALVADITGNQVVINKGGSDGFRPGMVLSVERVSKTVKDPATGKVLRVVSQPIGRIQLVEVDPSSSVGKVISGKSGSIRVGDRAKSAE